MYLQKIEKEYLTEFDMIEKYYGIISVLNSLDLTKREIQLLAFIAVKGTISTVSAREEFCEKFGSSVNTIFNMISELKKKRILVKENNKIKINQVLLPDFSEGLVLVTNISVKNAGSK